LTFTPTSADDGLVYTGIWKGESARVFKWY